MRWSTDGSKFLVQSGSAMDVYAVVSQIDELKHCLKFIAKSFQNMDLLYTITHPSRIHDAKFCSRVGGEGELLLVAAEDHKLSIYDVPKEFGTPTIVAQMIGHTNR